MCNYRFSPGFTGTVCGTVLGCSNYAFFILDSFWVTSVVATRCEISNSAFGAEVEVSLSSATFNNCVFNDNSADGIFVAGKGTIHLHGEDTAIHSNKGGGISAWDSGKVFIHLPSHHNTSYNNGDEDRKTSMEGTITNVED